MVKLTQLDETLSVLDNDVMLVSQVNINKSSKFSISTLKTTIKSYLDPLYDLVYAKLASPIFTGTPSAPTAAVGTNTTQLATTAFVHSELLAPANSLSANGYQKLPSGLIIQWGSVSSTTTGAYTVAFPIAFPNACFNVTGTDKATSVVTADIVGVGAITKTNVVFWLSTNADTANVAEFYWFAIGY